MFWDQLSSASSTFRCWGLVKVPPNRVQRWTLSAGQLMDIVRWNLQRHIPVKMRGVEDDEEETTKSFTSRSTKRPANSRRCSASSSRRSANWTSRLQPPIGAQRVSEDTRSGPPNPAVYGPPRSLLRLASSSNAPPTIQRI